MVARCSHCKEMLSVESFGRNKSTVNGLSKYCKACRSAARKKNKAKLRDELRSLRDRVKDYGCSLCKESERVCIDLHHINSDAKEAVLGVLITNGLKKKVVQELFKVIPLCSNCHRKVGAGILELDSGTVYKFKEFLFFEISNTDYRKYLDTCDFGIMSPKRPQNGELWGK